ncbi:MAG: hypothetical protein ACR2N7_06520 [Acidimicrobiia bacterium]
MIRRLLLLLIAVVLTLVAGCSEEPTATPEYQALEQELAAVETKLASTQVQAVAAEQELAKLVAVAETINVAPPQELADLINAWFAALEQGDDSVLDLYVAEGYHLYGDKRFEYDELVGHLAGGGVDHQWITGPVLIAEDSDGRYVVARGMRNTTVDWSNASALLFEIVTTPEGELQIVQTAWFYDSEW